MSNPFENAPIIHAYTRADAIADSVLIDVSECAREVGITIPVAMTSAAWSDCVVWSKADSKRQTEQDQHGRLWDVLSQCRGAIRASKCTGGTLTFTVLRIPRGGRFRTPRKVVLQVTIGPGDSGEPVLTIMLPGED